MSMSKRKFTTQTPPPEAGKIVAAVEFQGQIIVACQFGVFRLVNGKFEPIAFVSQHEGMLCSSPKLVVDNSPD